MSVRLIGLTFVLLVLSASMTFSQRTATDLAFGQVYGSVGFLSSVPSGVMVDAPATVIVFTGEDEHRSLSLTQQTGDYIALLEPGRYCIAAYTRSGKRLEIAKNQLKCVTVENSKDARLDIMLVRDKK